MALQYVTPNQATILKTELEEKISATSTDNCVKKNTKSIPYTQTVGGSDSAFPGKNYVLKVAYGQEGNGTETILPVVMGNDANTVDASYSHTLPIRDVDGRLYCYCYTSREGKSISADTEYMACNVGAVNFLINKKVPTIESTADDGTYTLKATKSGTTITYNWVKDA